jgi:hypothetical protein
MRTSSLFLTAVSAAMIMLVAAGRAQSPPIFTLSDSDVTIDSSTGGGRSSMLLRADKLEADRLAESLGSVNDLQFPSPPPVTINITPQELPRADNNRRWLLVVDIKGLPRNATQKRYLSVKFAGQDVVLPYTLTNKSTASFSWSIKSPPGELSLSAGDSIGVGIAIQAVPASHARVMQSTLIEQSRKVPLDGDLLLCAQLEGQCEQAGVNLDANSANRLWLRTSSATPIIGKYVGAVIVGADQKPDGETLNLTIYGTTLWGQIFGGMLIAAGVVCAWLTTTLIQSKLNRAQALLPARLLTERVYALQKVLNNAPNSVSPNHYFKSKHKLDALAENMSEKKLDAENCLPRSPPNPFKGMEPNVTEYKRTLDDAAAQIGRLDLIVNQGFAAVWKLIPPNENPASAAAIDHATEELDKKVDESSVPSAADTISFIQKIIADLHTDLANALNRQESFALIDIQPPSFEKLVVEIRHLSLLAWLIFGLLAVALGAYVIILSNLGFGVPSDYLVCLFWGFGLPVSGQQLVQSTVGSVGSALGFSVPKTT